MTGHGSPARGARGIGRCAPLRARGRTRDQSGQALVPVLAVTVLLLLGVGAVTVVGAGHVAAARAQRVADLAAVSAVRALPRALGDARLPTEGDLRGRLFAAIGPTLHGTGARVEALAFPDASDGSWPPTSVQVRVAVPGPLGVEVRGWAHAGLAVAAGQEGAAGWATGGGYSGPLVRRDGKPACPAVIAAFDLMDAAAHRDGIDLVVTSGFRSDAEQAVLFARHPDPRWVAPPGRSRHRNATELDIGGGRAAWAWLRVHAGRFGFLQRYSWEPWHYGYLPGCGATHGATPGPAGTAESPVGTSERRTRARGGAVG